jgi:hypothetical protein
LGVPNFNPKRLKCNTNLPPAHAGADIDGNLENLKRVCDMVLTRLYDSKDKV